MYNKCIDFRELEIQKWTRDIDYSITVFGFTETDITVTKQEGQGSVDLDVIRGGTLESLNLFGSFNVKAVPLTAGKLCTGTLCVWMISEYSQTCL